MKYSGKHSSEDDTIIFINLIDHLLHLKDLLISFCNGVTCVVTDVI